MCAVNFITSFLLTFSPSILPLKIDMEKFLQKEFQPIDLKTEFSSHSAAGEDALSLKVMQNFNAAISPY